ncbi:AGE family epimerase/isomerase [Alkalilimnicola ehrlichii]|uniref:AGE family epimerase/isomerase n=1 Tax=Alkalilimnicola ehrlichii TaxID=351052 RepID=UPI0015F27CFD|nr:AGE family epimerase/isomerase [Alkalilimnicola ehrlichii]
MRTKAWFGLGLLLVGAAWLGYDALAKADNPVAQLPEPERWIEHLEQDLMPFWMHADARGVPKGAYPTFRCRDGSVLNVEAPCPELAQAPSWVRDYIDRDYTRMRSRQAYTYGVAFHMTGKPEYLALAKAGVNWIREHALDPETGSAISYWHDGEPGPATLARNTQDLAYAQLGMAMYYYLTRDPDVREDILRLKRHIFTVYYDPAHDELRWTVEGEEAGQRELVAQLDQINAYMLLLAPILPQPYQAEWKRDLNWLSELLIRDYYSDTHNIFWGTLGASDSDAWGARHNDFGHSIKAFWMIHQVGTITGNRRLIDFAAPRAARMLADAFVEEGGHWANRPLENGIDTTPVWWAYAELDQTAATLALQDPEQARYLPATYQFWLDNMVDRKYGGVWGHYNEDGEHESSPKAHLWKNGYHEAEHALVALITTAALRNESVDLYFAPTVAEAELELRPYFSKARRKLSPLKRWAQSRVIVVSGCVFPSCAKADRRCAQEGAACDGLTAW